MSAIDQRLPALRFGRETGEVSNDRGMYRGRGMSPAKPGARRLLGKTPVGGATGTVQAGGEPASRSEEEYPDSSVTEMVGTRCSMEEVESSAVTEPLSDPSLSSEPPSGPSLSF